MTSTAAVLEKLKQEFIAELPEKIQEIEEHILAVDEGADFDALFQEVCRKVHSLKGSGGTFGISLITSICHQLEDALTQWREFSYGVSGERQKRCLDYVDLLCQVSDVLNSGTCDLSSITESLREMQGIDLKDRLRVMLVDSSRTTREICKQAIQPYNVEVVEMVDGYEALGRLLNEHFDILIVGKEVGLLNGPALISVVSGLVGKTLHSILLTSSKDSVISLRVSEPSVVVNKGVEMVNELQALFKAIIHQ